MIDLTEIKKLPDEEKWKIIDEIEESMEGGRGNWDDIDPETIKEMERRLEDMRSGKDPGYTWEEAEAIWRKTLKATPTYD